MMLDWIGWCATAVFITSYFARGPVTLRRIQGVAAGLWALYGALIHALPVLVANILVAGVAVWSSIHHRSVPPNTEAPGS